MTRGRKPGSGASAERILAALKALGTETDGRPKSIRAAQLSDRAKIPHPNLAKAVEPLLTLGHITRCLVTGARGQQTYEYRLGCGAPPPSFKPLNLHKAGVAIGKPGKPLPVTTPAPRVSTTKPPATEIEVPQLKRAAAPRDDAPREAIELDINIKLDELGYLFEYWKRRRAAGYTPMAIRAALVSVIGEIAGHTAPVI